jgi:cobalt-zinc-cadmium efflux system membrane fusion protein
MNRPTILLSALSVLLAAGLSGCGSDASNDGHGDGHAHDEAEASHDAGGEEAHGHGHDDHAKEELEKGANGGRLHVQGDLAVELKIEESGQPPRYVAWVTKDGKPVDPSEATVEVRLERLGEQVDTHWFTPVDGRLQSDGVVGEPHSFVVTVRATVGDESATWTYDSFEGRTTMSAKAAEAAGVRVAAVGPGVIAQTLTAPGRVIVPPQALAEVGAPFPGVVRRVAANPGDRVAAGATLAIIESGTSLSTYTLRSPITGTVMSRTAEVGQRTGETSLFGIANLDRLAVELPLFGADALQVTPDANLRLRRLIDGHEVDARIERVLPAADALSQSLIARASVPNDDGRWRPGMAVEARIVIDESTVPIRVPTSALQRFRDWQVAFIRIGEAYEIRPLELGRSDGAWVEVREGLNAGDEVVVEQSFLVKADIEKSGASHDH